MQKPENVLDKKQPRKPKWPKIRKHLVGGYQYWIVDRGLVNGKRKRETFKTKGEADTRADALRAQRENEGKSADLLPQEIRFEASACQNKLSPFGVTLTQATEYYLKHVIPYRDAPIISKMVEEMITAKKAPALNLRPRTIGDLQHKLRRFARAFGEKKLTEISKEDLEKFILDPTLEAQTIIGYAAKISELYNWAIEKGYAETNLTVKVPLPQKSSKQPGILSIKQCEDLLKYAPEFNLLPYVALGLFAGIRSRELSRLSWGGVKLSHKVVEIGPDVAKKRSQRNVDINPTLRAWIKPYMKSSGKILEMTEDEFDNQFTELRQKAGISEWPDNALRHSFASYHLQRYNDPARTSYLLGHKSSDTLDTNYKTLVTPKDARKFWALRPAARPAKSATIIPFLKAG